MNIKRSEYKLLVLIIVIILFPSLVLAGGCRGLFTQDAWDLTRDIFKIISIIVPILLIGLASYDMVSVITAGDQREIQKAWARLGKRMVAAVLTFLVPTLIMLLLNLPPVKSALNLVDDPLCGISGSKTPSGFAQNEDR